MNQLWRVGLSLIRVLHLLPILFFEHINRRKHAHYCYYIQTKIVSCTWVEVACRYSSQNPDKKCGNVSFHLLQWTRNWQNLRSISCLYLKTPNSFLNTTQYLQVLQISISIPNSKSNFPAIFQNFPKVNTLSSRHLMSL